MAFPRPMTTVQPAIFRPGAPRDAACVSESEDNNALKATARIRAIELRREAVRDFWRAVVKAAMRAVHRARGVLRFVPSQARSARQLEV